MGARGAFGLLGAAPGPAGLADGVAADLSDIGWNEEGDGDDDDGRKRRRCERGSGRS